MIERSLRACGKKCIRSSRHQPLPLPERPGEVFGGRGASGRGAFVGGDLLIDSVTEGDRPLFGNFVESFMQGNDILTGWRVKVGGVEREFEAQITELHSDESVNWNSTGGPVDHGGVVTFLKLAENETRVTVQLD